MTALLFLKEITNPCLSVRRYLKLIPAKVTSRLLRLTRVYKFGLRPHPCILKSPLVFGRHVLPLNFKLCKLSQSFLGQPTLVVLSFVILLAVPALLVFYLVFIWLATSILRFAGILLLFSPFGGFFYALTVGLMVR